MSKEYNTNIRVDTTGGKAEVTKIPKSCIPPLAKGYQIVITIPFLTKAIAQSVCDRFIKCGLEANHE